MQSDGSIPLQSRQNYNKTGYTQPIFDRALSSKGEYEMRKITALFVISGLLTLSGCVAVIVGAGVSAGAYAYINGELKRTYQAKYDKTLSVCTEILNDLEFPIKNKTTDGVETTITAERKDGTPMTIKIKISGLDWTEVSVRTGSVGMWKKELSQQFHEFIEKKLANN